MHNTLKVLGCSGAMVALVALSQMVACTTDDADPNDANQATGGTGGSGSDDNGGSGGAADDSSSSGGKTATNATSPATGTAMCADAVTLASATSSIANFENYDGAADLTTWSYTIGTTGVYAGPFAYGDDQVIDAATNKTSPETYAMVDGSEATTYALTISDTEADEYGGGMGIWLAKCLNASVFEGISFWVRGTAPTGSAKLSLPMEETTTMTAKAEGDKVGTCPSTKNAEGDCVHPSYSFPVTAEWKQIQVPWAAFTAGTAMGTAVKPNGNNITQVQFDIGVNWEPDPADATGVKYIPVPAAYELVVDTIEFY